MVQIMVKAELIRHSQIQRFKMDLLRILQTQSSKLSKLLLLLHMPMIYEQVQYRNFIITDYGVCDINYILDNLVSTNTMISIPERKQSTAEKTSNFGTEVAELFNHASHYIIPFEKFACSCHYTFGEFFYSFFFQ